MFRDVVAGIFVASIATTVVSACVLVGSMDDEEREALSAQVQRLPSNSFELWEERRTFWRCNQCGLEKEFAKTSKPLPQSSQGAEQFKYQSEHKPDSCRKCRGY
ncbi:hypothetical protein BDV97DRAFT_65506 [Delphinella strobiligena]|nr:hypothetical protein BDV97DRAFT_65506 [Delphinella strobiligena]